MPARPEATLGFALQESFAARRVKESTAISNARTGKALSAYFGETARLADFSVSEAEKWRRRLKAEGLAEATIAKRVKNARQIFRQAIR